MSVLDAYDCLIKEQGFAKQLQQEKLAGQFDLFEEDMNIAYKQQKKTFWQKLWRESPAPLKKGIYLYGDVGRGKSMMMDLFFHHSKIQPKTRIHFHHFMKNVHERLHFYRGTQIEDPILAVAGDIAAQNTLFCFDEMQILDITDAMIVGRLFEALYAYPMFFVMTSNRHPKELYKNGLNRPLFEPFIDFLEQNFHVMSLNHDIDFRQQKISQQDIFLSPITPKNHEKIEHIWHILTDYAVPKPHMIEHLQRKITLPKYAKSVIRGTFADFCEQPYSSHDYLAMIKECRFFILENIPKLTPEKRNEVTRFRYLIDVLYEAKIKCYFLSEQSVLDLYPQGDFVFEFERTISRLMEMQSEEYARLPIISLN